MASSFFVGILDKVGVSYTFPSAKLAGSRSARRYADSLHRLVIL